MSSKSSQVTGSQLSQEYNNFHGLADKETF